MPQVPLPTNAQGWALLALIVAAGVLLCVGGVSVVRWVRRRVQQPRTSTPLELYAATGAMTEPELNAMYALISRHFYDRRVMDWADFHAIVARARVIVFESPEHKAMHREFWPPDEPTAPSPTTPTAPRQPTSPPPIRPEPGPRDWSPSRR